VTPQLQATLAKLPTKPGVYLLKDARGVVLYVGKAQNLRNRVRQYWQKSRGLQPLRIEYEMDRVADVEYTMTDSVSEALLLEATLIKRHQPRFNVRLKDDKSYPYIKVTWATTFRASSGRASCPTTDRATSGRMRRRRASTRQ
jgi:excinuclease ABC subunit C